MKSTNRRTVTSPISPLRKSCVPINNNYWLYH